MHFSGIAKVQLSKLHDAENLEMQSTMGNKVVANDTIELYYHGIAATKRC
jgi:hypothetical protein